MCVCVCVYKKDLELITLQKLKCYKTKPTIQLIWYQVFLLKITWISNK